MTKDGAFAYKVKKAVDMGFKHMEHTDTMARALLAQTGQAVPQGTSPEAVVDPKLFPPLIDMMRSASLVVRIEWGDRCGQQRQTQCAPATRRRRSFDR